MNPTRLDGLVAIVTGGGQGIGRGIAARLVAEGAKVLVMDQHRGAVEDAVAEYGEAMRAAVGSIADESDVTRVIAYAVCAYLASSDAGFITGQVFTVDGGMTRKMTYES